MAANYARQLVLDKNGSPYQTGTPAASAISRYVTENGTASSVLTLTQDTTAIEVATGGTAAVIRWVATSDTQASVVAIAGATANFDHEIPANAWRRFVVPVEQFVQQTSLVGANRLNGLYQRVAIKSQGV